MTKQEDAQSKPISRNEPSCPICFSANLQKLLDLEQVPVLSNVIWDRREDALSAPRGDINLTFCECCGHVFNRSYDPAHLEYTVQYENSLHYSPRFQEYASWLAHHLVDQYDLHGKSIVEIGSGKGDFLRLLCDFGGNVGTGFDPSFDPSQAEPQTSMSFVRDVFSERYTDYQADLICSRHTLEHIFRPVDFVQMLRRTIGNRQQPVVFVEVPNLGYILRDSAIWDVIYEHYSYFGALSLSELFSQNGFNILNIDEAYAGQFLYVEAIPRNIDHPAPDTPTSQSVPVLARQVSNFKQKSKEKIDHWRDRIDHLRSRGKRAVIWGAGSKGISLLNLLHIQTEIEYVVDVNPRKRNKFITGAGQQIIGPDFLTEYRPDTIIVMNPIYRQEIQAMVNNLGLEVDYLYAN